MSKLMTTLEALFTEFDAATLARIAAREPAVRAQVRELQYWLDTLEAEHRQRLTGLADEIEVWEID